MARKRKSKSRIKEKPAPQTVWPLYLMGLFFLALPILTARDWKIVYAVYFAKPQEWKATLGVITNSRLEKEWHAKSGTTISAEVKYSYSVSGQKFQNDNVKFSSHSSSTEEPYNAEWIVHNYPVGRKVRVYYLATMPEVSALEPQNKDYTIIIPPTLCFLVAVGFFAFAFKEDLKRLKSAKSSE